MGDLEVAEVAEEMEEAVKAPEPGTFTLRDAIHAGDDEYPAKITAILQSAGYAYVYDIRTGERSVVNRNMLGSMLLKKREDGTRVFTVRKPKVKPWRGNLKCLLHPDGPQRAYYDRLGLPVCKKSNLTSDFHLKRHMQSKHKVEWSTIETDRVNEEKAEERRYRDATLQAFQSLAGKTTTGSVTSTSAPYEAVSPKPKRTGLTHKQRSETAKRSWAERRAREQSAEA